MANTATKGPWIVSTSTNAHVYDGEEHLVILSHPVEGTGQILADIETLPEAEANARLMAAAPDLLAALDLLLEQTVDMDLAHGIELTEGEREAREKALAAVAKARGKYQPLARCDCEFHQCMCEWPQLKTPPTQAA